MEADANWPPPLNFSQRKAREGARGLKVLQDKFNYSQPFQGRTNFSLSHSKLLAQCFLL